MNATVRNIGNSKGVIIPKSMLKECAIEDNISVEVKDKHIIITAAAAPAKRKRQGWAAKFKEMAAAGDDALVIPDVLKDEDTTDWTWK